MKTWLLTLLAACTSLAGASQSITIPPSGDNQKSSVTQWIGLVSVTVTYNSPNVHGPQAEDRTGHIWGELVPYGFTDPGYGTSTSAPWRAGSNENTTIEFSHGVTIDGKAIAAGKYGIFLVVEKDKPWTWILSTDNDKWGHYHYNPKNDIVRVAATPKDVTSVEWLSFGFDDRLSNSTVMFLEWERKRVELKIEVPNINELYVDKIRGEIQGHRMGFSNQSWIDAANFCAQNKVNLEEALQWAEYAISGRFIGKEDFRSLQAKANVLDAMGKSQEAGATMMKAMNHSSASMQELHNYGRSLLNSGKKEKAMEVFKLNRKKHPEDSFTTYVGLARAYTAIGDKKNAIKNWEIAIKNLPDDQKQNVDFYKGELSKLKN
jgi:hypothetical protein